MIHEMNGRTTVVSAVLLIATILLVLLDVCCAPGRAAESTLRMIGAAAERTQTVSDRSGGKESKQSKASPSTVWIRIQVPKKPCVASTTEVAPVLGRTPPSALTPAVAPVLGQTPPSALTPAVAPVLGRTPPSALTPAVAPVLGRTPPSASTSEVAPVLGQTPPSASTSAVAPVLGQTPPSTSTHRSQPVPYVRVSKQPDGAAVTARPVVEKQANEKTDMSVEPIAQPADGVASGIQEWEVSNGALPMGHCQCPYYPAQSGAQTICGIDCSNHRAPCDATWKDRRPIPWSIFGQGEYVGPARTEHTYRYFLRVDDQLQIVYILSREKTSQPYRFGVGDKIRIESVTDETLNREVVIQPDGFIALPLIDDVQAAGKTVKEMREVLQKRYAAVQRIPRITVTPMTFNIDLQDIVNSVDRRYGLGGQSQPARVTPEGTLQLPGLGSIFVQGLTLNELKSELEARYHARYGPGLSITPLLVERAPSYVFVGGEVAQPGRYTLEGPTTVMQAITLAGGWNVGGNTNQVVVFRRDENWCLKATKLDLFHPLYGKDPCPVNDVWLRANDLVIIPKRPILVADDIIELYFTRGVYAVFPVQFLYNYSRSSVLP